MKIAFICDANNPHVIARIKYLLSAGHEIFYYGLPHTSQLETPAEAHYFTIEPKTKFARFKIVKILSIGMQLRRLTRDHEIDILHIMWLGYMVYDLFCRKKKTVFEIMGSDILVFPRKSLIWRLYLRFFFPFADSVIQDSNISQVEGLKHGASKINNQVIEVGVDFKYFNNKVKKGVARERLGLNNKKFVFSPRSFTDLYNIEVILHSINQVRLQFPDVQYVFCKYSGTLEEKYKSIVENEGLSDNVIFAGFLDNEQELPYFYRDADVVLSIPSSDSSPKTVYEAMACYVPVIVSELPWYLGKFEPNRDLLAVPLKDTQKLSQAIVDVLCGDITLDLESAYNKVLNDINQEKENRKLEKLYLKIFNE